MPRRRSRITRSFPPCRRFNHTPRLRRDVFKLLRRYPLRWLLPAVLITALAVAYAKLRPAVWEASQGLMVRDEADRRRSARPISCRRGYENRAGNNSRTGQEPLGRCRRLLTTVGPPADREDASPLADRSRSRGLGRIDEAQPAEGRRIRQDGSFLSASAKHRSRTGRRFGFGAVRPTQKALRRFARRQSTEPCRRTGKTVTLAQNDLHSATVKLADMDAKAGSDLGEASHAARHAHRRQSAASFDHRNGNRIASCFASPWNPTNRCSSFADRERRSAMRWPRLRLGFWNLSRR